MHRQNRARHALYLRQCCLRPDRLAVKNRMTVAIFPMDEMQARFNERIERDKQRRLTLEVCNRFIQ